MSCASKTNGFLRRSNFPLTHVRRASLRALRVGLAFAGLPSRCPRLHPTDPPTAGRFSLVGRSRHASIQRPRGTPLSGRFEFFSSPVILAPVCLLPFDLCLTRCCSKQSSQNAQREQQNHRREVQSPNGGKHSSNRRYSRLGQVVHELHQWMTPVGPNP